MKHQRSQLISNRFTPRANSYYRLTRQQELARIEVLNKISKGFYKLSQHYCLLCGKNNFIVIAERDRYSLPVRTCICSACGLVMTNPLMRSDDYSDFYQNHYTALYAGFQYSPAEFFENQQAAGKRLHDTVTKYIDLKNLRVAEVGCAAGGILFYFKSFCKDVVGCDYESKFMVYGKGRGLKLMSGGVQVLREYHPDLIIYSHVLEHILDINSELETVASILPENGCLVIDVPGIYNIPAAYESDFLSYLQNAHLVHFTSDTLTSMLSKHGFTRIYADERCIAIFSKTGLKSEPHICNELNAHLKTMDFLRHTESRRVIVLLTLLPRKLIVWFLKALGIHVFVRNLYRKLTE
jgi:SAM-dependent methyltransferase